MTEIEPKVRRLRRAYQRQLRRKPTMLERLLMDNAARLAVKAEEAAADLDCSPNDVVRLCNCSRRAHNEMRRAFDKR